MACACIGNVLTLTLTRCGHALVPVLAWSMGHGAALTGAVVPVIALAVSATLEGWIPHAWSTAGMALCLAGVRAATRGQG